MNDFLYDLSQDYYLSKNSDEKDKIKTSLNNIKTKLRQEFGDDIIDIVVFGSYSRKTILPRLYDENSDIDLMIVFDHDNLEWNPSTYRKHLLAFAEKHFPNSDSYKAAPTVVLELNHIKYDLVPAHQVDEGFFRTNMVMYIPESDTEWMETDPHGFSMKLEEVNAESNYNVNRVIRLLKAWNAKVGYPLDSYELEQDIAEIDLTDEEDLESAFFTAIDNLSDRWDSYGAEAKVEALKKNAEKVLEALEDEDNNATLRWLGHILPLDK